MLIPSTITALRTRRYTSTWNIHPTIHRLKLPTYGWRRPVHFATAVLQLVNRPASDILTPPTTAEP